MNEDGEGGSFASSPTALLLGASHGSLSAQQLQNRLKRLLARLGQVGRSNAGDAAASVLLDDAASALLAAAPSLLRHRKRSVRQLAGACFHELGRLCALPRDTDGDGDGDENESADKIESNDDDGAAVEGMAGRESGEGEVCHSPLLQSSAEEVDDGDGEIVGARRPMRFRRAKGMDSATTKRKPPPDQDDYAGATITNELADERAKEVDDGDDDRLASQFDDFPAIESEVFELMKKRDWSKTPLGSPKTWPAPMKMALEFMLSSRFPMSLAWGDDLLRFYNDACISLLGEKHPTHLGTPASVAWPEIWHILHPMVQQVLATGRPTWVTNKLLPMNRSGFIEEVYLTWSYSAIRDDDGVPRGVMTISWETTSDVISSRQIQALQALASRGLEATTYQEVRDTVFDIFAKDCTYDIPFACLYLLDDSIGGTARLANMVGYPQDSRIFPTTVVVPPMDNGGSDGSDGSDGDENELSDQTDDNRYEREAPAPVDFPPPLHHHQQQRTLELEFGRLFREVLETRESRQLDLTPFDEVQPCGGWNERPRACVLLPLTSTTGTKTPAVLVAGVNPRHALDNTYNIFFNLVASQVGALIANASSKEEEHQMVQARTLADLDRAKTLFFSNISHEFRTPLTLMLGPLEDLLAKGEVPEKEHLLEQLSLVHRNSLRLLKLVNSLLDFSKIEAGRMQASFRPLDLAQLTQDLASTFRSAAERVGLKLVIDCQPINQYVFVDTEMWEKIVLNLLSNALKFTIKGRIEVRLQPVSDTHVELVVQDTGVGIPAEELGNLGKRFHRIQCTGGRTHEGTGIGLALVYELVRIHGGTVTVESQLDVGSTFRVRIPLGSAHLPRAQVSIAPFSPSRVGAKKRYSANPSWWLPSIEALSSSSSASPTPSSSLSSSSSYSENSPRFHPSPALTTSATPPLSSSTSSAFQSFHPPPTLASMVLPASSRSRRSSIHCILENAASKASTLFMPPSPLGAAASPSYGDLAARGFGSRASLGSCGSGARRSSYPANHPYHFAGGGGGGSQRTTPRTSLAHNAPPLSNQRRSSLPQYSVPVNSPFVSYGLERVSSEVPSGYANSRRESLACLPSPNNSSPSPSLTPYSSGSWEVPLEASMQQDKKYRILLADDNFDMREYLGRLLSEKYEVVTVCDGLEALHMVEYMDIDLVLTDVMMPRLDGLGLLKELRVRDQTKTIPVILLSARTGEESHLEGLAAGADDYLIKPFTARELLARVSAHIHMACIRMESTQREQELRLQVGEAKEGMERILASIQDAFIAFDSRFHFTFVNDNAALLCGAEKEDMLGKDVWEYMVDTSDGIVRRNLERAITESVDTTFEFYHPSRDCWYEERIYPGAYGGACVFILDTTARKKTEERLSLLAKVSSVLSGFIDHHIPSLIASILKLVEDSVVAEWCILDVLEEGAGGSLKRIFTPEALPDKWEVAPIPADQTDLSEYDLTVDLYNGERVGARASLADFIAVPLAARGRVFGIWLFARSSASRRSYVDEERAACEELARRAALAIDNIRLYQDAENANHAKDHFLAALSHELRTPLTPALLLSETLQGDESLPQSVMESIRTIHESVELEVQLIDDLLDLTKVARGKLQLHRQYVEAHELVDRTLRIVDHELLKKKLLLRVHLNAQHHLLHVDPARMQQVFWNIIKNAIKFTPVGGSITVSTSNLEALDDGDGNFTFLTDSPQQPYHGGGGEASTLSTTLSSSASAPASMTSLATPRRGPDVVPKLAISAGEQALLHPKMPRSLSGSASSSATSTPRSPCARRVRAMLRIEVCDSGIGIESHILPHLFHAFEQGDASITVRFGGLGMGLAISSSLVKLHHGSLSATSEGKDKGACFTICLPTVYSRGLEEAEFTVDVGADLASLVAFSAQRLAERGGGDDDLNFSSASSSLSTSPTSASPSPSHSGARSPRSPRGTPLSLSLSTTMQGSLTAAPDAGTSSSASTSTLVGANPLRHRRPPISALRPIKTTSQPALSTSSASLLTSPSSAQSSSSSLSSSASSSARQLRILLVEDNKSTLLIMSRLLQQRLGYHVTVASTVAEALDAAEKKEGQFDLVLSDIGLPDGTGLQLMKALKQRWGLKGIALSGYGMMEDVQRSKDAGFETHLTKPINFAVLTATIQKVLPGGTAT